jgi:hypothetical protein
METSFLDTPHLYRHRFDIDDVIAGLCGSAASTLNTGAGTFEMTPLPLSYLEEALAHPSFQHLPAATQTAVKSLAANLSTLTQLPQHFGSPAGDWLRERIKDAALEWLDSNNLIPPSMKHGPAIPKRRVKAGKVEIV